MRLLLVKFLSIFILLSDTAWGLKYPGMLNTPNPSCITLPSCDAVNGDIITVGKININQGCTCMVTMFSRLDSFSLQWIISISHTCLGLIKTQFTVSSAVRSPSVTCRGHHEMYSSLREWERPYVCVCVGLFHRVEKKMRHTKRNGKDRWGMKQQETFY